MSPRRKPAANLVEAFLDMMSAERGAGANTLAAYGRDLGDFTAYLAGGRSVATATTDDIRTYLGDQAKRGMQPRGQIRDEPRQPKSCRRGRLLIKSAGSLVHAGAWLLAIGIHSRHT